MRSPERESGRPSAWGGVVRNSALALACRAATVAANFFVIPVIIRSLGIAGYGLWETIVSLGFILFLLQNVISSTLLWWMSQAYGRGERETLSRAVGIGLSSLILFSLVTVPAVWLARHQIAACFNIPPADRGEVSVLIALYVALFAAGGVTEILASLIAASQRMGQAQICQVVGRLVTFACAIGGLQAGYGLRSMVAGHAAGSLVYGVLLAGMIRRLYPGMRFVPLIPTREEIGQLRRYAGYMTIGGVATALREQTDKVILAAFASPAWVGYYGIATRLASLLLEFRGYFYPSLAAASGALYARGALDEAVALYRRVFLMVAGVTGAVFIGVVGGDSRLMIFWLGSYFPEAHDILLLLVAAYAVSVLLTGPQTALCRGIGRVELEIRSVVVGMLLNLCGTVALVLIMGPIGTLYATVASSVAGSLLFSYSFQRTLFRSLRDLACALGALALALIVTSGVRELFHHLPLPATRGASLLSLVGVVLPAVLLYGGLLVRTGILKRTPDTTGAP